MSRETYCYATCPCRCNDVRGQFEELRQSETRFTESLRDVCHSNVGWYTDKSLGAPSLVEQWGLRTTAGIYVLWHKDGYCATHDLFHMRSLYVGKGHIERRLLDHWKRKDFSGEQLVYWTYVGMPNRQAKYYEQLLLDTYNFPFNSAENHGTERLCAYLSQTEVD